MGDSRRQSEAGYNRSYYEKNRKRIAARKKMRYDNDPEYHAKMLANRKRQREREKIARATKIKISKSRRAPKRMRILLPSGEQHVTGMYSLGQAAYQIGVSGQTLRKWEGLGVLPPALYRTTGKHRLYTVDQVAVIKEVFHLHKKRQKGAWRISEAFITDLHRGLDELVRGCRVLEGE